MSLTGDSATIVVRYNVQAALPATGPTARPKVTVTRVRGRARVTVTDNGKNPQ